VVIGGHALASPVMSPLGTKLPHDTATTDRPNRGRQKAKIASRSAPTADRLRLEGPFEDESPPGTSKVNPVARKRNANKPTQRENAASG
jgi:hypothetical protein